MLSSTLLIVLFVVLILALSSAASAQPHPFNVHDLVTMRRLADLQARADDDRIVFVVRRTDMEAGKGVTDIFLARNDGSDLRQLTSHPNGSSHPRWAPDGSAVYFLAKRGAGDDACTQVYRIPRGRRRGDADHRRVARRDFLCRQPDGHAPRDQLGCLPRLVAAGDEGPAGRREEAQVERSRLRPALHPPLGRMEGSSSLASLRRLPWMAARPWPLMGDMQADAPSKPFGGAEEYTFTPDGKRSRLLLAATRGARKPGRPTSISTPCPSMEAPILALSSMERARR